MKRILFFETTSFTGATRVTRTIAKKVVGHFEIRTAVISNIDNADEEVQRTIIKEKPDILFSSFSVINPNVIKVGKENGLLVVVRSDYQLKDLPLECQERVSETYLMADWVIVQTPEMKQELLESITGINAKKVKVLENPLDEEYILLKASEPNPFPDNGNFHFLWVGRRDPIKDLPTLQKAFDMVHEQYPNTDLTLISDDPNPYRWMKYAECLVISSKSEASPNVLHEALFLGTKVLSTDCSPTVRRKLPAKFVAKVSEPLDLANKMMQIIKIVK